MKRKLLLHTAAWLTWMLIDSGPWMPYWTPYFTTMAIIGYGLLICLFYGVASLALLAANKLQQGPWWQLPAVWGIGALVLLYIGMARWADTTVLSASLMPAQKDSLWLYGIGRLKMAVPYVTVSIGWVALANKNLIIAALREYKNTLLLEKQMQRGTINTLADKYHVHIQALHRDVQNIVNS